MVGDDPCLEVPLSGTFAALAALLECVAKAGESMRFGMVSSAIPWKFSDGMIGMLGYEQNTRSLSVKWVFRAVIQCRKFEIQNGSMHTLGTSGAARMGFFHALTTGPAAFALFVR